jgi:hypothetical protein
MTSRHRTYLILALAALVVFTIGTSVSAQGRGKLRTFSGGWNNNSNDNDDNNDNDNENQNDNSGDNNRGRNRRNRDRNDDENNGGFQLGGSDAQKIQQAIQGFQGNSGQGQQLQNGQQGLQFKNNQQRQNFQLNNQGHGQNQFRRRKHNMQSWAVEFGGGSTPFSQKWYEDHPKAFHHHHHHHDNDAWKVATAANVIGWLGWGAHHHAHDTHIVYHPVPIETYVIDPHAPGEWMTLGVYTISTGPGDEGTRLVELAVDKHGHIRGNYYDSIANVSHNITGHIHEPTQQVQWRLDTNQQLVFFTPLSQLTQSQGVVYVKLPSGKQQQWQLARMEYAGN